MGCGADGRADLIIDDVWVIDATGRDPYLASVCVDDGRIREITTVHERSCTGASEVIPGQASTAHAL